MGNQDVIHPARAMAFGDLIDGMEKARAAGLVSRKVCRTTGLLLYCYTQRCVYDHGWNAFTLLARGLIVDHDAGTVVATPFPKFFNLGERGAVVPDLPFEAFEKLDGSLIIVFYHAGAERWRAATKGAFDSSQAVWAQARLDEMDTSGLAPGTTYLFEAIYPENVIVVRYPDAGLSLLAAYNASGRELAYWELVVTAGTTFRLTWRHTFATLTEMVLTATDLPRDREGFVIRFADGTRVKGKGNAYKAIHGLISRYTPLAVWDVMAAGGDLDEMRRKMPEEFWTDFDQIAVVLQARYLKLVSGVSLAAELAAGLSDKELGLRLSEVPDPIRPFLFPFRKANTPEAREKLRLAMLRTIRPHGNLLDGYVPSCAISNALDEAA